MEGSVKCWMMKSAYLFEAAFLSVFEWFVLLLVFVCRTFPYFVFTYEPETEIKVESEWSEALFPFQYYLLYLIFSRPLLV